MATSLKSCGPTQTLQTCNAVSQDKIHTVCHNKFKKCPSFHSFHSFHSKSLSLPPLSHLNYTNWQLQLHAKHDSITS